METSGLGLLRPPVESRDYLPLLRWMILAALIAFGVLVLAYFDLVQLMLQTDRSRISILILAIFCATSIHCAFQTAWISRELATARHIGQAIAGHAAASFQLAGGRVLLDGRELPANVLTGHIANLAAKSRAQNGKRVDQTLLLRALADRLRSREKLGWFVAEALLRLALLGTAVGFIFMLVPIAGLNAFDVETLRLALANMSGGMAVALNVTVTGIAAALLLKLQYFFLDEAVSELFGLITEVTEVHVVSSLERGGDGGA